MQGKQIIGVVQALGRQLTRTGRQIPKRVLISDIPVQWKLPPAV